MSSVLVVGAGLMGSGIAQVAAVAGWDVTMRDVTQQALDRGVAGVERSLARMARSTSSPSTFGSLRSSRITFGRMYSPSSPAVKR